MCEASKERISLVGLASECHQAEDGFILGLLATEMTAVTGHDPRRHDLDLAAR